MKFTIPLSPITKKNSSQIIQCHGRPMIIPSKQYKQYEKDCKIFMPHGEPINRPINVKALYYMPTRRKVDLVNLLSATDDILVKYNIICDDNRDIIASHDGSRVYYDKNNPRTELEIEYIGEYEQWAQK